MRASEGFWIFRILWRATGGEIPKMLALIALFSLVLPVLLFVTCAAEGTLHLAGLNNGRGLFEHYGTWSLLLSCPIILFILCNILDKADQSFRKMKRVSDANHPSAVRNQYERLGNILRCKLPEHRLCFYLLVLGGVFAVVVNIQNTRQAAVIYGHEVWDSSLYPYGYVAGKVLVATFFMYVLPITVYVASTVWFVILSLSGGLSTHASVNISPYHPDKCGGYRHLGATTLAISYTSLPFLIVVVGHYFTHQHFYEVLAFACAIVLSMTIALLYLPFIELHKQLKSVKEAQLEKLHSALQIEIGLVMQEQQKPVKPNVCPPQLSILAASAIYQQTEKLKTWPYVGLDHLKWLSSVSSPILALILRKWFG